MQNSHQEYQEFKKWCDRNNVKLLSIRVFIVSIRVFIPCPNTCLK